MEGFCEREQIISLKTASVNSAEEIMGKVVKNILSYLTEVLKLEEEGVYIIGLVA